MVLGCWRASGMLWIILTTSSGGPGSSSVIVMARKGGVTRRFRSALGELWAESPMAPLSSSLDVSMNARPGRGVECVWVRGVSRWANQGRWGGEEESVGGGGEQIHPTIPGA